MRAKRDTDQIPASSRDLHVHDVATVELLQIIVWLLLLVVALVTVLIFTGCGARQWKSPQWMGKATFDAGDVPLSVWWDREEFDHHNPSIEAALDMYPCNMLVEHTGGKADIVIRTIDHTTPLCGVHPPLTDSDYAQAVAPFCRNLDVCEIWLDSNSVAELGTSASYLLIAHELGHCLDLDHDPRVSGRTRGIASIMIPNALDHAGRIEKGLPLPILERDDEHALRQRYCR